MDVEIWKRQMVDGRRPAGWNEAAPDSQLGPPDPKQAQSSKAKCFKRVWFLAALRLGVSLSSSVFIGVHLAPRPYAPAWGRHCDAPASEKGRRRMPRIS